MIHSGMFNDTTYSASDFNLAFKSCLSNGVLGRTASNLQIVESANMLISASAGVAWIEGSWLYNDNSYSLTIANADGTLHRIDRIVARQNLTTGENTIVVVKGVNSDVPTAPDLVRDGTYYDLSLATIYIAAGTTAITQSMITDTRYDSTVCGQVYCLATDIDTTTLFAQYDAKLTQLIEDMSESDHVTVTVNSDAVSIQSKPVDITELSAEKPALIYNPTTDNFEAGVGGLSEKDVFAVCTDGITTLGNKSSVITWYMPKAYIPNSVVIMGSYWFYQSLIIDILGGDNLTTVGSYFAQSCTSLTSLSLPALTTVGSLFAQSCTSLTSLSLPALTTTGSNFAQGCPLTHLKVGGANTLTLTSTTCNTYTDWKLPVADMVAFGTALKTATTTTALVFGATYWNALSTAQKAIFTNKNYTVTTG